MKTFKAELFIFTILANLYIQLKYSPSLYNKIYRVKFVSEKTVWKVFQWRPFHLIHTVIIGTCLVRIISCGSTASKVFEATKLPLTAIKNTHYQPIQWLHTQHKKFCVKLVLKRCDDLIYIKVWKIFKFLLKRNILFITYLRPTIINRDLSSIGLYRIWHEVMNQEGLSWENSNSWWLFGQISDILHV